MKDGANILAWFLQRSSRRGFMQVKLQRRTCTDNRQGWKDAVTKIQRLPPLFTPAGSAHTDGILVIIHCVRSLHRACASDARAKG